MKKFPLRFYKSIFFKLLVIMIFSGLAIEMVVVHSFKKSIEFKFKDQNLIAENVKSYIIYLIESVGSPPDIEKLKSLKKNLGIDIVVVNKSRTIKIDSFLWNLKKAKKNIHRKNYYGSEKRTRWIQKVWPYESGHYKDRFFTIFSYKESRYWIVLPDVFQGRFDSIILIELLTILSLILLITFYLLRKLLRPLKFLKEGAINVSNGNYAFRIDMEKIKSRELNNLAATFNSMFSKIEKNLNQKQQLLLDVSHELRTPLTRMKVANEFNENRELRESISEDIAELDQMIHEVLEAARLEKEDGNIDLEKINLHQTVEWLVSRVNLNKQVINIENLDKNRIYLCNEEKTKKVIKNIIENALKYTDKNSGKLTIKSINMNEISFEDNGIGIEPKELLNIFEPFYRTDKSRVRKTGGYGLGLYLCKKIMIQQKGDIIITSKVGFGTIVTLKFPSN